MCMSDWSSYRWSSDLVAPAEFFDQLLFAAANEAQTALHPCFGREALTTLGGDLESKGGRHGRCVALSASSYRARNCAGRGPYSRRTGKKSPFRSRRYFPDPPRRDQCSKKRSAVGAHLPERKGRKMDM